MIRLNELLDIRSFVRSFVRSTASRSGMLNARMNERTLLPLLSSIEMNDVPQSLFLLWLIWLNLLFV